MYIVDFSVHSIYILMCFTDLHKSTEEVGPVEEEGVALFHHTAQIEEAVLAGGAELGQ